jgi:TolA-binding protein
MVSSREPSRESSAARPVRVRVASATAVDTQAAAEESAYEAAHRVHFTERDPTKALAAWDAYLSTYPDGRFALEARYNRALALVRLGRTEEARAALGPFADGRYGAYRRVEARDLIDALSGL